MCYTFACVEPATLGYQYVGLSHIHTGPIAYGIVLSTLLNTHTLATSAVQRE